MGCGVGVEELVGGNTSTSVRFFTKMKLGCPMNNSSDNFFVPESEKCVCWESSLFDK